MYKQFSSEVGSIVWGLDLYVCFYVFQSINQSTLTCYGAPHPKLWGARNTVKIQQHKSVTIMITMVCFSWCQFCVFCEYFSWFIWVLLLVPVLSITCKDFLLGRLKNTSAYLLSDFTYVQWTWNCTHALCFVLLQITGNCVSFSEVKLLEDVILLFCLSRSSS